MRASAVDGNRREFERALSQSSREQAATLLLVDLDHFQKLNDPLGQPAGDAALKHSSSPAR